MEKEFTDKIEGVKSLALLVKEREKMAQQMMNALEYCKQQDEPVTAKDTEKLKSTESEVIADTIFSEKDNCA